MRTWFARVNGGTLKADAMAGLTGAAIVLPQGVAFAIIAGLPPEFGLFTTVVVALIAGIWGSSMSQFAAPGSEDYIASTTIVTLVVLSRFSKKVPSYIIALAVGSGYG